MCVGCFIARCPLLRACSLCRLTFVVVSRSTSVIHTSSSGLKSLEKWFVILEDRRRLARPGLELSRLWTVVDLS